MFWIIATVILLGSALLTRKLRFGRDPERPADEPTVNYKHGPRIIFTPLLFLWILLTLLCSVNTVDTGHVGLVRTFGEITGQQGDGLNFKAPYQSVEEVDGRILKKTVDMIGNGTGTAGSIDNQVVYAKLVVNYQVREDGARELYSDVGPGYYNKIIEPAVQDSFKNIASNYKAIEMPRSREKIRSEVRADLVKRLSGTGIELRDVVIKDLDFSKDFLAAIERKQTATEDAKAAAEQVAIAKAQADSVRATAQGDADAAIIAARGEAKAIAIKGQALRRNPNSLALSWIEKINPNVQGIYLDPNGSLVQIPGIKPPATQ